MGFFERTLTTTPGQKMDSGLIRLIVTTWGIAFLGSSSLRAQQTPTKNASFRSANLEVTIQDNSQSPGVLSGIQSLFHHTEAPSFDAYDPDTPGASAGLNFEHIISGHANPNNKFTPRHGRYPLFNENENSCILIRDWHDSPWKISSSLRYQVTEPNAVDFTFECEFHDLAPFGSREYAVFFFANYMNDVIDPALHFRGVSTPNGPEKWIRADAPQGHPDYIGGGTYRHAQALPLNYDADHDFKLNLWSYDSPRFTRPFCYGRAANGMSLILMFDRTYSDEDEIRFSLFKFKLPKHPRPAWDFQYVVHHPKIGRRYGFKGRLIWKPFVSPEDCEQEYQKWTSSLPLVQPKQ